MLIQFDEYRLKLKDFESSIKELESSFDIEKLNGELAVLDEMASAPDFWSDAEKSQQVIQRTKQIKEKLNAISEFRRHWEDLTALIDLAIEFEDDSQLKEIEDGYASLIGEYDVYRIQTLLNGEYDKNNAIMSFHAGAGGTEAQDWVERLYRMYSMWAERHKFKVKTLDYLAGDEAGIKSAVVLFEGTNAYGYLKSEAGVHRLVRISPFDSSGRRHTSFASVEVMPEIDDSVSIEIQEEDLRIDTYRSGGAGGQHVNKTESAIRITHIPTGVVVACQNERSQFQNRDVAMRMLKSKLIEIKEREHIEKIEDIKGVKKDIEWGSQIRSYVFMPYTLAKDHRTGFESGNIGAVMDGDLDGFINAFLIQQAQDKD